MAHPCPPRRSSDLWIDLGVVQLQPSELMKIALVLVLARYFHGLTWGEVGNPLNLIPPLLMVGMPVVLVMRQPDLGTAVMIIMGAGAIGSEEHTSELQSLMRISYAVFCLTKK